MSLLFYRRPAFVDRPKGPLNGTDCQRYIERTKGRKDNIPSELSFDNIVADKALSPCTLQDFMNYLVYVAHNAENLQFYLWLRDYTRRYNALRKEEKALSPEWKPTDPKFAPVESDPLSPTTRLKSPVVSKQSVDFEKQPTVPAINFDQGPISPSRSFGSASRPPADFESFIASAAAPEKTVSEIVEDAHHQVGLKWQPFGIQPFREEINKVVATYIAADSPRELNISHRDRTAVLHALQHTTHPTAFTIVSTMVESTLRGQLHPNFIRWSICNGNKPRVFFARATGVTTIAMGCLVAVLLTLSSANRWFRVLASIEFFLGITTMIAAYKGLCIILAHSHSRTLRPWEDPTPMCNNNCVLGKDEEMSIQFSDAPSHDRSSRTATDLNAGCYSPHRPSSLNTFGSANTFVDEPWVEKQKRKNILRKIFERTTWTQDPSLRFIQDRIVRQSQVWALLLTIIITAAFVALPAGNFY